jgi:hypothetical protein
MKVLEFKILNEKSFKNKKREEKILVFKKEKGNFLIEKFKLDLIKQFNFLK